MNIFQEEDLSVRQELRDARRALVRARDWRAGQLAALLAALLIMKGSNWTTLCVGQLDPFFSITKL